MNSTSKANIKELRSRGWNAWVETNKGEHYTMHVATASKRSHHDITSASNDIDRAVANMYKRAITEDRFSKLEKAMKG